MAYVSPSFNTSLPHHGQPTSTSPPSSPPSNTFPNSNSLCHHCASPNTIAPLCLHQHICAPSPTPSQSAEYWALGIVRRLGITLGVVRLLLILVSEVVMKVKEKWEQGVSPYSGIGFRSIYPYLGIGYYFGMIISEWRFLVKVVFFFYTYKMGGVGSKMGSARNKCPCSEWFQSILDRSPKKLMGCHGQLHFVFCLASHTSYDQ